MNIEVQKEDIKRIGNTIFSDDEGNTCFICDCDTANIEAILLRNILKCFGDYEITSEEDWDSCDGDVEDVEALLVTNLPYSVYKAV